MREAFDESAQIDYPRDLLPILRQLSELIPPPELSFAASLGQTALTSTESVRTRLRSLRFTAESGGLQSNGLPPAISLKNQAMR